MAKGYWIAHGRVDDPAAYDLYRAANAAPLAEYGGRFLVRGGARHPGSIACGARRRTPSDD